MQGILADMIEQGQKDAAFLGQPIQHKQEYGKAHKTVKSS